MNQNIECEYFSKRFEFGLVLLIIGMQLNTAVKNVFISLDHVQVLMFFSFLLTLSWCNFLRGKFPRLNINSIALIAFEVVLLIIGIFSRNMTNKILTYHLYIIAIIISLSTQPKNLSFKYFFKYLFFVSGFISIVILFQATNGFKELVFSYTGTDRLFLKNGGDPITMARALEINIVSILLYKSENRTDSLFKILFVGSSIIGLLSFFTRAVIIGTSLIVLMYIVHKRFWKFIKWKKEKVLKCLACLVIVSIRIVVIVKGNVYFSEKWSKFINTTLSGIATYTGNTTSYGQDGSTITRYYLRQHVYEIIDTNPSLLNILIGYGYNLFHLDFPIMQAFFNFGILGGCVYAYFTMFIPGKYIIKDKPKTRISFFIKLFAVQYLLDQFYCGLPFDFFIYTSCILIICIGKYMPNVLTEK